MCDILVISVGRDVLAVKAPNFAAFLQLWRSTCWPGAHAPSRPRPSNNSPSSPNAATPSTSPKVLTSLLPPSLPPLQPKHQMDVHRCLQISYTWGIFGFFFFVKFTWRSIHPCAFFSLIVWALDCTGLVWPLVHHLWAKVVGAGVNWICLLVWTLWVMVVKMRLYLWVNFDACVIFQDFRTSQLHLKLKRPLLQPLMQTSTSIGE